jgi:hypothetical protein
MDDFFSKWDFTPNPKTKNHIDDDDEDDERKWMIFFQMGFHTKSKNKKPYR